MVRMRLQWRRRPVRCKITIRHDELWCHDRKTNKNWPSISSFNRTLLSLVTNSSSVQCFWDILILSLSLYSLSCQSCVLVCCLFCCDLFLRCAMLGVGCWTERKNKSAIKSQKIRLLERTDLHYLCINRARPSASWRHSPFSNSSKKIEEVL